MTEAVEHAAGETPTKQSGSPLVMLVVGMAGTGKTTLVHRIQHYAASIQKPSYYINLDPAVRHVPYNVNIDIRDTVKYAEVMKTYRLGPNGAIMTSLNLFATKFNQVVDLLERRRDSLEWIVIDTPGQIEAFTWSASGQLFTEALMSAFPTIVLFVADTTRCSNAQTFMSTMMYASGIMLKQQIPLTVVFNKTDVVTADAAMSWMKDNDALEEAVAASEGCGVSDGASGEGGQGTSATLGGGATGGYAVSLARSMGLFLHEFYESIPCAAVSAASGAGMPQFAEAVESARLLAVEDMARRAEAGEEALKAAESRQTRQAQTMQQDMERGA